MPEEATGKPKRTMDERMNALTERHEALAQSLEIIAGMQQVNERQIEKLLTISERTLALAEDQERRSRGSRDQKPDGTQFSEGL